MDHKAEFIHIFVGIFKLVHDSYVLLMKNHFKDVIVKKRLNKAMIEIKSIDNIKLIIADVGYISDGKFACALSLNPTS